MMPHPSFHAVVLAAQRTGIVNPLAVAAGVSHKCLIELEGKPLITHVLDALAASPHIGRITVSVDAPETVRAVEAVQQYEACDRLTVVPAEKTLFDSLDAVLSDQAQKEDDTETPYPCLITTADNVLLTPDMIGHFCGGMLDNDADAGIAMTAKDVLLAEYPDGQRRFHRFADGEWSNCNLYAVMNAQAMAAARAFKTGGQFAKSPMRVLQAFGFVNALAYRYAWFGRDRAFDRMSRRFGTVVKPVDMPFAEAPIDVDNQRSKRIAGEVLNIRRRQASPAASMSP